MHNAEDSYLASRFSSTAARSPCCETLPGQCGAQAQAGPHSKTAQPTLPPFAGSCRGGHCNLKRRFLAVSMGLSQSSLSSWGTCRAARHPSTVCGPSSAMLQGQPAVHASRPGLQDTAQVQVWGLAIAV